MLSWIRFRLWTRGAREIEAQAFDWDDFALGTCGVVRVTFTGWNDWRVYIDFTVKSGAKAKYIAAELNKK